MCMICLSEPFAYFQNYNKNEQILDHTPSDPVFVYRLKQARLCPKHEKKNAW